MKRSCNSAIVMLATALEFLAVCRTPTAIAGFTFGEPTPLRSMTSALLPSPDEIYCFSYDGLEMYFGSPRPGGQGDYDLWVSKRASPNEDWGPRQNLGPAVNSPQGDYYASISADGLSLYFASSRGGASVDYDDLYVTTRATRKDPWGPAVNLGPVVNRSGIQERSPWILPNGLELYFMSHRSGGYGGSDFWVTRRATADDPWGQPVNLGLPVNTAYYESYLSLSPDGLLLLFNESYTAGRPRRPGGYGESDMWMSRRASLSSPWQTPVNLGPRLNSPAGDFLPRISPDGRTLYFLSDRTGWDCWQASLDPVLDFNTDGRVDEKDVLIMTQHWGEDYPPCDVGPFAWGDGIVDGQDWIVLLETIEGSEFALTPKVHAADVPRDVILSWTLPKFAKAQDVYFAVSLEDVRRAGRADPRGVLVSRAQSATTYDPEGLLEFNCTYYWRVDFVVPGPTPTVYQGPVLNFKTVAYSYPITTRITTTASGAQRGMGPEKTVDRSGLDKSDGHSTQPTDMWLSTNVAPAWILYEFDQVYTLHEMWVWNHNWVAEPAMGFGSRKVGVEHSTDGTNWTSLADTEFARAPGQGGYVHNTTVSFNGVPARYVRLTAQSNWGGTPAPCGLSEVRFFYIPDRSATHP